MVLVAFLTHSEAERDAHSRVMLDSGSGGGLRHPCFFKNKTLNDLIQVFQPRLNHNENRTHAFKFQRVTCNCKQRHFEKKNKQGLELCSTSRQRREEKCGRIVTACLRA